MGHSGVFAVATLYRVTHKYLYTLTGGVVRDLDWTKEVIVKKSHKSENTFRFSGVFKKTPIFPSQSVCEKLP